MRIPQLLLALLLPLLLLAAACGDDDDDNGNGDGTPADPSDETPAAGGDEIVGVATIDGIGEVLVDGDGFTLYIFTNDSNGESVCTGDCAANWPPLTTTESEVTAPEGADGEFTLFEREDGSMQVVYEGQPLYRFAADTAPGEATGEGVGDVWFVARPDPDAARSGTGGGAPDASTNTTPASADDPYYE
jgi:predicted lipoprotein with Yx(FWY)xxD motif